MTTISRFSLPMAAACIVAACCGCQQAQSTAIQTVDYELMASQISKQLRQTMTDGFLTERGPGSPEMVIAVQPIVNFTHDLISQGPRWYLIEKVRDTLDRSLQRDKNITFVIAADYLRQARASGAIDADMVMDRNPTHVLHGRLDEIRRDTDKDRTDHYTLICSITRLEDGEEIWSDRAEFKRWAHGHRWN